MPNRSGSDGCPDTPMPASSSSPARPRRPVRAAPRFPDHSTARRPGPSRLDLGFLDTLGNRLDRQGDLALALVAGRLSSEHLQREMGLLDAAALRLVGARRARRAEMVASLALQADCLTGVWAAAAAGRLGPVPDGLLRPGRLVLAQCGRPTSAGAGSACCRSSTRWPLARATRAPRRSRKAIRRETSTPARPRSNSPPPAELRQGRSRSSGSSEARRGVPSGCTGSGMRQAGSRRHPASRRCPGSRP